MPTISELETFRLSDAVNFNDELNPALWENDTLKPLIRNKLVEIAEDFITYLGVKDLDVKDITISGSNAAYSYTPHSDLDLHVIVDFHDLPEDDIYRELFNAKKTIYNDTHTIKVKGVPVELYVQDSNQVHTSLGEYSVLNDKWISIPKKKRANFDEAATKAKYESLKELVELALKTRDLDRVNKVLDMIKRYRKAGLEKAGEFGPENLAFKAIRKQGGMQDLFDLRNKLRSEQLSVEEALREHNENTKKLAEQSKKNTLLETTQESEIVNILSKYIAQDIMRITDQKAPGIWSAIVGPTHDQERMRDLSAFGIPLHKLRVPKVKDATIWNMIKDVRFVVLPGTVKDKTSELTSGQYSLSDQEIYLFLNPISQLSMDYEVPTMDFMASTIAHELQHHLDNVKSNRKAFSTKAHKNNEYLHKPAEINARVQELMYEIGMAMSKLPPGSEPDPESLQGYITSRFKRYAFADLTEKQKRKIMKRAYLYTRKVLESPVTLKPATFAQKAMAWILGNDAMGTLAEYAQDIEPVNPRQEFPITVYLYSIIHNKTIRITGERLGKLTPSGNIKTQFVLPNSGRKIVEWLPVVDKKYPTGSLSDNVHVSRTQKPNNVASDGAFEFWAYLPSLNETVLTELADKPYEYEKVNHDTSNQIYRFTTDNGAEYEVNVIKNNSVRKQLYLGIRYNLEIHFHLIKGGVKSGAIEKTGDSVRVFSTVANILLNAVKEHKPDTVSIMADASMPSRTKLYKSMAYRLAKLIPDYEIHSEETITTPENLQVYMIALAKKGEPSLKLTGKGITFNEASGYIPSEKEKNDDRFKMGLSIDVRPNAIKKNANAFNWKTNRAGVPPELKTSGKINESRMIATESQPDIEYFMSEGCGVFAYALWLANGKPANGDIMIISDSQGEPWFGDDSDEPTHDFEATHVYYEDPKLGPVDVKGPRNANEMIDDFRIHASVEGPFSPEYFLEHWMGDTDYYPLWFDRQTLNEAIAIIKNNPELYLG